MLLKDSLSGNCRTCLVVTIADEQESISESQATLRFGITAGQVNTKVSTQKTVNVQEESARIKEVLEEIYGELDRMEANGMSGYLDESQPKVTRDQFVANFLKLKELETAYSKAEKSKREGFAMEINNYKGLLIR